MTYESRTHLLFAHPVVDLLSVPVEELQVHALLILLPAQLPQLQQGLLLLRQDAQLHTHKHTLIYVLHFYHCETRTQLHIHVP